jgi:hypothetical protein
MSTELGGAAVALKSGEQFRAAPTTKSAKSLQWVPARGYSETSPPYSQASTVTRPSIDSVGARLGSAFSGGKGFWHDKRRRGQLGFGAALYDRQRGGSVHARMARSSAELLRGSGDGVRARGEDLQDPCQFRLKYGATRLVSANRGERARS